MDVPAEANSQTFSLHIFLFHQQARISRRQPFPALVLRSAKCEMWNIRRPTAMDIWPSGRHQMESTIKFWCLKHPTYTPYASWHRPSVRIFWYRSEDRHAWSHWLLCLGLPLTWAWGTSLHMNHTWTQIWYFYGGRCGTRHICSGVRTVSWFLMFQQTSILFNKYVYSIYG